MIPLLLLFPFLARGLAGGLSDRDPTAEETVAARAFLRRFDEACASGEPRAAGALVFDGAPGSRRRCESNLLPTIRGLVSRKSELLLLRASQGSLGAFVRAALERERAEEGTKGAREEFVRHEFLLLRPKDDGLALSALLDFDPAGIGLASEDPVGCDWCNWRLSKPEGWFAVYRTREACGATEGVTFLPPSGELAVEFRVFDLLEPRDPLEATALDDARFCRLCGHAPSGAETVLRRAIDAGPGLAAAESELRCATPGKEEQRVLRTYVLHDRTLYALVGSTGEKSIDALRPGFAALAKSFALLEPRRSPEEERREILRHHPGGTIEGNLFRFDAGGLRVTIRAPEGWSGAETSGPTIFRVRFRPPEKGGEGFLDAYAMRDASGWPDRRAVAREFEDRERELRGAGARDLAAGPRTSARHEGLKAVLHRCEYAWTDEKGARVRELFAFAPLGLEAICVAARAPREAFEGLRGRFDEAIASLGRR